LKNIQITVRALLIAGCFTVLSCKDNTANTTETKVDASQTTKIEETTTQAENNTTEQTESNGIAYFDAGIKAIDADNMPLAFKEFLAAANEGHAFAQYNVGIMYEQGIGTSKNPEQAFLWYNKSANQDNAAAQFNVGVSYENGIGTEVDYTKANEWYRKASLQGDGLAVGNLGMLYIRGEGVNVDKVAGVALLLISANLDTSPENQAKNNISKTRDLTPEMIEAAQALATEMKTSENILIPLDQYLKK